MYPENTLHFTPSGDMVRHVAQREECWCNPVVKLLHTPQRGFIWFAQHNPVDGRDMNRKLKRFLQDTVDV